MDWSRIKTIFIIAFLILDVFLLTQYINKFQTNQLEVRKDLSFEEKLNNDGITYKNLPKETMQDQYLSANTKIFTEKDVSQLKNQTVQIGDGSSIVGELKNPISVDFAHPPFTELESFMKNQMLHGDQYTLGEFDEEEGTITYYQEFKDKPFFMNIAAHIVFYVNEEGKADSYEQTMLDTIEPISEKEEVYPAIRALEALYNQGAIKSNSKFVETELGYYTLVNMEATQVLTPVWRFVVDRNGERESLLVNAFEGQIIQANSGSDKNTME